MGMQQISISTAEISLDPANVTSFHNKAQKYSDAQRSRMSQNKM